MSTCCLCAHEYMMPLCSMPRMNMGTTRDPLCCCVVQQAAFPGARALHCHARIRVWIRPSASRTILWVSGA